MGLNHRFLSVLGAALFLFGLLFTVYLFVNIQVLASYYVVVHGPVTFSPLIPSAASNDTIYFDRLHPVPLFGGCGAELVSSCLQASATTYDLLLFSSAGVSFAGFVLWQYFRQAGAQAFEELKLREGLLPSLGKALAVFGGIGALATFIDVQVTNGIYQVGNVTFTAIGYPWWGEQVATDTCFIKAADYSSGAPNCSFLNYGDLFLIALLLAFIGLVLYFRYSQVRVARSRLSAGPDERPPEGT